MWPELPGLRSLLWLTERSSVMVRWCWLLLEQQHVQGHT
jgi:hypothetical protein